MRISVLQPWIQELPLMQQTVLLLTLRGPDGQPKYTGVKRMIRWYRRCVLVSALQHEVLTTPYDPRGGSFTGPSIPAPENDDETWESLMRIPFADCLREVDAVPHHFLMHFIHGIEILGFKHPIPRIRQYWNHIYHEMCKSFHMHNETENELDERLGDTLAGWEKYNHEATRA